MLAGHELGGPRVERGEHRVAPGGPAHPEGAQQQFVGGGQVALGDPVEFGGAGIERCAHEGVDAPPGAQRPVGLAAGLGDQPRGDPEVPLQAVQGDLVVGVGGAPHLADGVGVDHPVDLARGAVVPFPVDQPGVLAGLGQHEAVGEHAALGGPNVEVVEPGHHVDMPGEAGQLGHDAVQGDPPGHHGRAHAQDVGVAVQLEGPAHRLLHPVVVGVARAEHADDHLVGVDPANDVPDLALVRGRRGSGVGGAGEAGLGLGVALVQPFQALADDEAHVGGQAHVLGGLGLGVGAEGVPAHEAGLAGVEVEHDLQRADRVAGQVPVHAPEQQVPPGLVPGVVERLAPSGGEVGGTDP